MTHLCCPNCPTGVPRTPRQAAAEREKRAKIIAAQGEALAAGELATASDVMMAHPLALQLRNLQTLVEVAVDKNLNLPELEHDCTLVLFDDAESNWSCLSGRPATRCVELLTCMAMTDRSPGAALLSARVRVR